jgi:hypothetical protein
VLFFVFSFFHVMPPFQGESIPILSVIRSVVRSVFLYCHVRFTSLKSRFFSNFAKEAGLSTFHFSVVKGTFYPAVFPTGISLHSVSSISGFAPQTNGLQTPSISTSGFRIRKGGSVVILFASLLFIFSVIIDLFYPVIFPTGISLHSVSSISGFAPKPTDCKCLQYQPPDYGSERVGASLFFSLFHFSFLSSS